MTLGSKLTHGYAKVLYLCPVLVLVLALSFPLALILVLLLGDVPLSLDTGFASFTVEGHPATVDYTVLQSTWVESRQTLALLQQFDGSSRQLSARYERQVDLNIFRSLSSLYFDISIYVFRHNQHI